MSNYPNYTSELGSAYVAPVDIYTTRKSNLDFTFIMLERDLSGFTYTVDVKIYPDAPGDVILSPSATVTTTTQTYQDWIDQGFMTSVPTGSLVTDNMTGSEITISALRAEVQGVPRSDVRGQAIEFYWSMYSPVQMVAAGKFFVVETA